MARASVELIVEAVKAINPLRRVQQQSLKVEQRLNKTNEAARKVAQGFQFMGNRAKRAFRDAEAGAARLGKRMGGLRGTVGKAAIAFAAFRAVQTGIQRAESERRIKLLGERFGEYTQLQDAATQAAQKFKLSQTEANQALANAFARLRPLGVSLEDITSTFGGFRTAAVLGGATAAEASAAFTQLSQALGSGALRGDEFRSIAEQAPLVLQAISDETGVAAGNLKEYAAQGLLTSDIVIKALKRIEAEGAGRLAQSLDGPAAKIKEFQNATEDVQVALTESVIPELSKSFVILADIITDLKPVIKSVGDFAATVLGGIASTIERIRDPNKLSSEVTAFKAKGLMARGRSLRELTGSGMSNIPALSAADEALLFGAKPTAAPKGTTPIAKPVDSEAAETAAKIAQASADRVRSLEQATLLASALTDEERKQFERQIQIADILENKRGLTDDQIKAELEATIALHEQQDATEAITKANELRLKQDEALKKKLDEQKKKAEELDNAFRTGIVDALTAAIEGTKSLGDSLLGVIKSMAKLILQQKLLNALKGFSFTGFLGFANGGRPPVGRPSIVGERGPELFVPDRAGTIIPNNQLGGGGAAMASNVVVNVDASGTTVEGNEGQSRQLGALIGAAVQTELIKQQRPGGLLSR
jgi:tape measure domain-containing protein